MEAVENKIVKIFEADDKKLPEVLELIENELEKHDCLMKVQMAILIVVEELFVNIAHYGYPGKIGYAQLDLEFNDDDVIITFTDSGIPFNPLEKEDPDITESAEVRNIGGLGIYMVKKTMDEVKYCYKDEKNILTVRKAIH